MQAQHILVLFGVSYTAAVINIYVDGPMLLKDCQSQRKDDHPRAESSTVIDHTTEEPAQTTAHVYAHEEPVECTMKSQVAEEPVDPEAFYEAARDGDICYINAKIEEAKISSDGNRLINLLTWFNWDEYNKNAIHVAATEGHVPVVVALLEAGVSPNVKDKGRSSPVRFAAMQGHIAVLRALLQPQYQANVNQGNKIGSTPIHSAAGKGQTEAVEILLDHGAEVNMATKYSGYTPLIDASLHGHAGTVEALIAAGARLDEVTLKGRKTALHMAAGQNHQDVVQVLLQNGANKLPKNYDGRTAADEARYMGYGELADLIDNWQ